ncbi:MAG: hypothetical protein HY053_06305 [Proteobacteria bacterium]|nr:hypothetical protein [Pseudomonadota bacterium]
MSDSKSPQISLQEITEGANGPVAVLAALAARLELNSRAFEPRRARGDVVYHVTNVGIGVYHQPHGGTYQWASFSAQGGSPAAAADESLGKLRTLLAPGKSVRIVAGTREITLVP